MEVSQKQFLLCQVQNHLKVHEEKVRSSIASNQWEIIIIVDVGEEIQPSTGRVAAAKYIQGRFRQRTLRRVKMRTLRSRGLRELVNRTLLEEVLAKLAALGPQWRGVMPKRRLDLYN